MVYLEKGVIMRNYNRENLILNVNTFGSSKSINFVKIENLRFFSNINKHSKIKMSFLFEAEDKKVLIW